MHVMAHEVGVERKTIDVFFFFVQEGALCIAFIMRTMAPCRSNSGQGIILMFCCTCNNFFFFLILFENTVTLWDLEHTKCTGVYKRHAKCSEISSIEQNSNGEILWFFAKWICSYLLHLLLYMPRFFGAWLIMVLYNFFLLLLQVTFNNLPSLFVIVVSYLWVVDPNPGH